MGVLSTWNVDPLLLTNENIRIGICMYCKDKKTYFEELRRNSNQQLALPNCSMSSKICPLPEFPNGLVTDMPKSEIDNEKYHYAASYDGNNYAGLLEE